MDYIKEVFIIIITTIVSAIISFSVFYQVGEKQGVVCAVVLIVIQTFYEFSRFVRAYSYW